MPILAPAAPQVAGGRAVGQCGRARVKVEKRFDLDGSALQNDELSIYKGEQFSIQILSCAAGTASAWLKDAPSSTQIALYVIVFFPPQVGGLQIRFIHLSLTVVS